MRAPAASGRGEIDVDFAVGDRANNGRNHIDVCLVIECLSSHYIVHLIDVSRRQ